MDQNNHGVATLQPNDFAVVDKDVIVHNFQSFTRSDWTKLEIAILIDVSESVTPRFRQEIADVLNLVSQTPGIPDENLAMFSFHGLQPALLCAGDCRASRAAEQLPARRAGALTPLFDTIVLHPTSFHAMATSMPKKSLSSSLTAQTQSVETRCAMPSTPR